MPAQQSEQGRSPTAILPENQTINPFSRRDFLKSMGISYAALALPPIDLKSDWLAKLDESSRSIVNLNIMEDSIKVDLSDPSIPKLSFLSLNPDLRQNAQDDLPRSYRAVKVGIPIDTRLAGANQIKNQFTDYVRSVNDYATLQAGIDKYGKYAVGTILFGTATNTRRAFIASGFGIGAIALTLTTGAFLNSACTANGNEVNSTPVGTQTLDAINGLTTGTPNPIIELTPQPPLPEQYNGIGTPISVNYLTKQAELIQASLNNGNPQDIKPQSTTVPPTSSSEPDLRLTDTVQKSIEEAELMFQTELFQREPLTNRQLKDKVNTNDDHALGWLQYAVAQGTRYATDGQINYWYEGLNNREAPFGNLAIYREKLKLTKEALKAGYVDQPSEYEIQEGFPKGLHLRFGNSESDTGSGLSIIGISEDQKEVVVAFEEYQSRIPNDQAFHEPRMRLAVIPPAELGRISVNFMKHLYYYPLDTPNQLTYVSIDEFGNENIQPKITLNTIDNTLLKEIKKEAGVYWVEKYPKTLKPDGTVKEWEYMEEPVVRTPDPAIDDLPNGLDLTTLTFEPRVFNKYAGKTKSVRVFAFDNEKKPRLTAKFDTKQKSWYWEVPTLNDYADLLSDLLKIDYTFGTNFVQPNTLPEYRKMVIHNFNAIFETSSTLMNNLQPEKGNYDLSRIQDVVRFTKQNGVHLTMQSPVWQYDGFLPDWFKKITDKEEVIRIFNDAMLKTVQACGNGKNVDLEIMEPVRGVTVEGNVGWRYFMEGNPYKPNPPYVIPEDDLRWIEEPLRTARAANPNIGLYIDQYSLEFDGPTNDQFFPFVQQILNDGAPLDGINMQGMVNAEEILKDVDGKMAQLTTNIKKYQALGLKVGCPSMKIFSKGGIDQPTLDNLWYRMVKTMLDAGVKRISCFTDDTSAHPLVLKRDQNNDTDIKNSTYTAVAKAYEDYYLQHVSI